MRTLLEYVNSSKPTIVVPEFDLKSAPLSAGTKVDNYVMEIADGLVKDTVIKAVGNWYDDNQKRRNVATGTAIDTNLYIADEDNKLLMSVINELGRIGVQTGVSGEFDPYNPKNSWIAGGVSCGRCNVRFTVSTYKQFREKNFNYTINREYLSLEFKKNSWGNGYNDLPAADMNILREKLYGCMNGTKCRVEAVESGRRDVLGIPTFRIILTATFDKSKLKGFLNELKSDKRLQNFAERYEEVSKGIAAYYASKRPGDYPGD